MLLFVIILFMFCPQKVSSNIPVPGLGQGRCYSWHRIRFLLLLHLLHLLCKVSLGSCGRFEYQASAL